MRTTGDPSRSLTPEKTTILEVRNLVKHFPVTKGFLIKRKAGSVRAVDDISFTIERGQPVGIVGESGSGKSTTANVVMRLLDITSGSIKFDGKEISHARPRELKEFRKKTGIVFQDPYSSLDPRKNIFQLISEPMAVHKWGTKQERTARVHDLLERVGLKKSDARRYPHQFSGGQRQRIAIARALALTPSFVVADEAVSALDVSVQAKILNLFMDIQREFNLSYLFITHDLSVLRHISNEVVVMYLGKIMEYGTVDDIFENPRHPYTRALLQAIPVPNPRLMKERNFVPLKGEIPSPINPPSGCRFRTRCPYAQPKCANEVPPLEKIDDRHIVACHYWRELYGEIVQQQGVKVKN